VQKPAAGNQRYKLELGRAERLYGAGQYLPARTAFEKLRPIAGSADRELIQLRVAQCEFHLRRWRFARDGLKPLLDNASRRAETLYYYAVSLRALGAHGEYMKTIRQIVDQYPAERWAEEALNSLATHHITLDEDASADDVFREMYRRFPTGTHAARAAWKIGWRAYREGRFTETVSFFERAAVDFPRSDYRPAWLYWTGRAHERLGAPAVAAERYTLATADYLNSYYGRLASRRLGGRAHPPRVFSEAAAVPTSPVPPNEPVVRALLDAGLYGDALNELRYARRVWGDSPAILATEAWVSLQQGQTETGSRRFNLLRGSINTMRRAYPQFMAAGGEELPREVLTVIFPLAYWDLIRKHSAQYDLDPYLVAALVAQESTFVSDIRSHANAYGLMQLIPSTARQMARQLKLTYSSRLLTNPEANVRMGTLYLSQKIAEFGGLHLAIASYNAGEAAVRRWMAERPGIEAEEFIDDIPYPETQNYVKRLLGTTEDYRRLYGSGTSSTN
jgi:soluble lytic murein transglycosylase